MANTDIKVCKYCNSKFHRMDFPQCFNRMITCGGVECEGKRRKELWRKKYYNNEKNSA
jgi:hypothetical protein